MVGARVRVVATDGVVLMDEFNSLDELVLALASKQSIIEQSNELFQAVVPMLADMSDAAKSLGLAQIVAMYLASFPEGKRASWLAIHIEAVEHIVPVMVKSLAEAGIHP